ncbi:MAG: hypothetical protein WBV22_11830 [Anaerolineaceae bacterium]
MAIIIVLLIMAVVHLRYSPPITVKNNVINNFSESEITVEDNTNNNFTDSNNSLLLRHLASSADWQLKQYRGVWRAIRRQQICGIYQMSWNDRYYSGTEPNISNTETIIFMEPYENSSFGDAQRITKVNPGEKTKRLKLFSSENIFMSELVISNPNLFLYIAEVSPNLERKLTQEILNKINNEFTLVLENGEEINNKGYSNFVVPEISVIHSGKQSFSVSDEARCEENKWRGDQSCEITGYCQVSGYINPGEFGYLFTKVFDIVNGEQLCSEDMQYRSMEYVGWSSNPSDMFFYDANITVCGGNLENEPARFELWFQPIKGIARKLLETTHITSSWYR